jgi:hypothetical protein
MTGPRSRRALLGSVAVAGLAGCAGGGGEPESATPSARETTSTDETAIDATATDSGPIAVETVAVRSSFLYLTYPDAAGVAAPDGTQFVFADVRLADSERTPPSRDRLALAADDRRFEATVAPGPAAGPAEVLGRGRAYDPDEHEAGWLAFAVPDPLDAADAALTVEADDRTFSRPLDAETVAALGEAPPSFELVDVAAPERVAPGDSFAVSVAVENVGEGDGVFRAALNQTRPLYAPNAVELSVPAGDRREWTDTFGGYLDADAERASFELVAPEESRELSVDVAAE